MLLFEERSGVAKVAGTGSTTDRSTVLGGSCGGLLRREVMPSTVRRGSRAGAPGSMGHNARSDQHCRRGARKARILTKGRARSVAHKEIHTVVRVQGGIHFHADPVENKDSVGNNTRVELEDRVVRGAQRVS